MSGQSHSSGFDGLRVVVFEARMAGIVADLVTKNGGVPIAAPALREIPIEENTKAFEFAEALNAGGFDVVIFETGVGVRYLVEALASRMPAPRFVEALGRVKVIARGPKPSSALRSLSAAIDFQVPEPNTWRETLELVDSKLPVEGLRVAVQEYGQPVPELTEGLRQRGAHVTRVPVYRWDLPEDTTPLREAIQQIAERKVGAVLFTAAQQVEHVLRVAAEQEAYDALRGSLASCVVVGSVGPTTSAALRSRGLPVDIEPDHPKSGHLVAAVAAGWRAVGKAH